jgi:hypothetical protein
MEEQGWESLNACNRYDNFILRLEWMIEKGGNTGYGFGHRGK